LLLLICLNDTAVLGRPV